MQRRRCLALPIVGLLAGFIGLPDLDLQTRVGQDLQRLLERWPDRTAFRDVLLRFGQSGTLGTALGGLKGQVPDPRLPWRTPMPWFRP
jgi:hypothetical protein